MQRGDEPADLFMVSSDSSDGVIVTQDRTPSGFENSRNVERFNDNCPGEGGSNLVVIAEERNEKLGASVSWTLKYQEEENSHASEILEPPNGELRQIRVSATLTHFYVTDILRFYETNYPSHY